MISGCSMANTSALLRRAAAVKFTYASLQKTVNMGFHCNGGITVTLIQRVFSIVWNGVKEYKNLRLECFHYFKNFV